jgi:hypothetical protein
MYEKYELRIYHPKKDIEPYELAKIVELILNMDQNKSLLLSETEWGFLDSEGVGRHFVTRSTDPSSV